MWGLKTFGRLEAALDLVRQRVGKPTTSNSNFSGLVASGRCTGARFETEEGSPLGGETAFSLVPALHSKPGLNFFLSYRPHSSSPFSLHGSISTFFLVGRLISRQPVSFRRFIKMAEVRSDISVLLSCPASLLSKVCAIGRQKKSTPHLAIYHFCATPSTTTPRCARTLLTNPTSYLDLPLKT